MLEKNLKVFLIILSIFLVLISNSALVINTNALNDPAVNSLNIYQSSNPSIIKNILSNRTCSTNRIPVEVVFSIDSSQSMEQNDPSNLRLDASKLFVDKLNSSEDRVAAVSWGGRLGYKSELISDFDKLKQDIGNINISDANVQYSNRNTDYNIGINEAIKILDNSLKNSSKIIIFLSDGLHNAFDPPPLPDEPDSLLDYAKSKGYKIYSVGLNISSNSDGEKLLRAMAESTGGQYYSSPSAKNIDGIFNSIFVQEIQHFEFENAKLTISTNGTGGTSERSLPIDVIFSLDASGSMRKTDPDRLRVSSSQFFTDKLNHSMDQVGIVSWNDKVEFSAPLSSNLEEIKAKLNQIGNTGPTDVNLAIKQAISLLDTNPRQEPSSKAIILMTDGESDVPVQINSLVQELKEKGYKLYTIGLTIKNGSPAETELIDLASGTNGQYYFAPTAENLKAAYEDIFQKVIQSTAPLNPELVEVLPEYVLVNGTSISILPNNITRNDIGETVLKWSNFSNHVGNKDNKLSSKEQFKVDFGVGFKDEILKYGSGLGNNVSEIGASSNKQGFMLKVPISDYQNSVLRYLGPDGRTAEQHIPQAFVNLDLKTCSNKQILNLAQSLKTPEEKLQNYKNTLIGFEMGYPQTWSLEEMGDRVSFHSPEDYPYDRYLEDVDVYMFPGNSVPTLDEVVKSLMDQRKTAIADFKLLDSKDEILSGHPSKIFMYTYSDPSWGLTQVMDAISLIDDKVYIISYAAKPQHFDSKLALVQQMLGTFKVT